MVNSIIFIVNNEYVKRYQYDYIDLYKRNKNILVAVGIVNQKNSQTKVNIINLAWKLINFIEKCRLKNNKLYKFDSKILIDHNFQVDDNQEKIFSEYDLIINLSDHDLPKRYIELTKYGLLQARVIDVMKNKISNSIFSKYNKESQLINIEYYYKNKIFIENRYIANLKYFYLNKLNAGIRSLEFISLYFNNLSIFRREKIHEEVNAEEITFNKLIHYIYSQLTILVNGKILQFMYKYKKWSVCICNFNFKDNSFQFDKIFEISDKNRGYADPFLININNKKLCFLEDYLVATGKGDISLYEIADNGPIFLGRIIQEDFHLSYPFVFEDSGCLYLVPESSKNNDIRLYKCIDFPLKWELHKVLLNNVSAVDTVIFKENNLWWLLTNINKYNNDESSSELHVYFAKDLSNSQWNEHPANPVSVSIENGRNGGSFEINQTRFRVGQSQKSYMYGHSFTVNKIIKLDSNDYREDSICKINPPPGYSGTHHLSICGTLAAYDQYK